MRKRGLCMLPILAAVAAVPAWSSPQGGRPDLVEASLSKPPAAAQPKVLVTASDIVRNRGSATARRSTTRYYLSRDRIRSSNDSLVASRAVPALRPGGSSRGQVGLITRVPTVPATYYVIVCADARRAVPERSERNNCRASATGIFIRDRGIRPPPPPPPPVPSR